MNRHAAAMERKENNVSYDIISNQNIHSILVNMHALAKGLTWWQSWGAGSPLWASEPRRAAELAPAASCWCTQPSSAAWWLYWSVPADRGITKCHKYIQIIHQYSISQWLRSWIRDVWSSTSYLLTVKPCFTSPELCWCSPPPPPFSSYISTAAAHLFTVPLCSAESWVLSQDYVKCQNPVWCWNASSALQRCELSSWSLFAADNTAWKHVPYITGHTQIHKQSVSGISHFPLHLALQSDLIVSIFIKMACCPLWKHRYTIHKMRNEMRQCVLPYLILSFRELRSLNVRTRGWRPSLSGLVVMFGLDVLENGLKERHMSIQCKLGSENDKFTLAVNSTQWLWAL